MEGKAKLNTWEIQGIETYVNELFSSEHGRCEIAYQVQQYKGFEALNIDYSHEDERGTLRGAWITEGNDLILEFWENDTPKRYRVDITNENLIEL